MSDLKLTQLAALTAPSYDDLLYIVDSPGGTPASKKVTTANLLQTLGVYTPGQFGAAGSDALVGAASFSDASFGGATSSDAAIGGVTLSDLSVYGATVTDG